MSKLAVEKVLAKGSTKQRAILLANHIAEVNLAGKGILTDAEFESLSGSFKSDQEKAAYNRYRKAYDLLRNYLPNLSQTRFAYACSIERLEKLLLLRLSNSDVEDLANSLIDLIPDKKSKAKALKRAKDFSNTALVRSIGADDEGYVRVTSFGDSLDVWIKALRKEAMAEQVELKTGITLAKDYLAETGLNVRAFAAYVKEIENWAKSKKGLSHFRLNEAARKTSPALNPFIERERLETPYAEVEVDQELYEKWRGDHFE